MLCKNCPCYGYEDCFGYGTCAITCERVKNTDECQCEYDRLEEIGESEDD